MGATKDQLIEKLADLEHQQWSHWTSYMLSNLTEENIQRWKEQINTLYSDLSEREKNSDRKWAKRVVEVLESDDG